MYWNCPYNTGLLLQKAGQVDDAARLYRETLEDRPGFPEALPISDTY
jgi:hypothetical protein